MHNELNGDAAEGRFIEVPWDALEESTLLALVQEFVSREGTDYGDVELSLNQKAEQVIAGFKQHWYTIVFDQEMQSCQIVDKKIWNGSVGI